MMEKNVIEPVKVKSQAIMSASEAARLILKIDDIIAASKKSSNENEGGSDMDFD